MDALEIVIILNEVIQTQNDEYYIAYTWDLKKWYQWIYLQNRKRLPDVENKFVVIRGETGRGGDWDWHIFTNKDILYSTGNSSQYSVMTYRWVESKKEWL